MHHLFDNQRTSQTFQRYFGEHGELLHDLLHAIETCLQRVLPAAVSHQIDREGSRLQHRDGHPVVERHSALEDARCELARMDLFRLFLPTAYGGMDLPVGLYYLAVQLIAYYDASLALVFLVHGNAMYVINRYGTAAQKQRYLPLLATGHWLATVAFTEREAGSDAGSIRTRVVRKDDGYLLNGGKMWITHGGDADLLVTTARTGPLSQGIAGVSTFLVERTDGGIEVLGLEDKTGLGGSPTAELSFSEVQLPADRLLGATGQGGMVMFCGVGMTRVNIGAQALGIAKRAFDAAVDFALLREQGGCRIVEHDAIQQRLVDMATTISAMENLLCGVAHLEAQGVWHVREMSVAKYFCSEALQIVTLRAINVFGGYGVSREVVVERCRREAVALPLFGGTSEIQWFIIARELLGSLGGERKVDYRARDRQHLAALSKQCRGGVLAPLARRAKRGLALLWSLVEQVATLADPAPYYRHLAELSTALAVAQALLHQAAAVPEQALEREMASAAFDELEDKARWARRAVTGRQSQGELKVALRKEIDRT